MKIGHAGTGRVARAHLGAYTEDSLFVVVTGRFIGASPFRITLQTGLHHEANQSEARGKPIA